MAFEPLPDKTEITITMQQLRELVGVLRGAEDILKALASSKVAFSLTNGADPKVSKNKDRIKSQIDWLISKVREKEKEKL